ncbi:MAG: Ldh family oxidoreductase [Alphaproteobacteria bacterium]
MAQRSFPAAALRRQLAAIFAAWGFDEAHIPDIVDLMVESDLRGIDSHGVGKIKLYERHFREGRINPRPNIRPVRDLPALALVDGDNGMGHLSSKFAMQTAIAKARDAGVGAVSVRHSYHIGACGIYSGMAAEAGMIGFAMTGATQLTMVPTFGRTSRMATNPIAFAAPGRRHPPFSLDMATTTVAVGKIDIARWQGKPIPEGWANDEAGRPETDPSAALAVEPKRLTPLGGTRTGGSHKGYGLAAMVETLVTILSGSQSAGRNIRTGERGRYVDVGHFYMAIDPAFFRGEPGAFEADLDALVDWLHATPPADPAQPVLVPGDPEHKARAERSITGIPMTPALLAELREVAEAAGARYFLEDEA